MRKKRIPHSVDDFVILENAKLRFPHDKEAAEQLAKFAITLNHLLEYKGIDQEKISNKLGISGSTFSGYRNGKTEPGLTKIIQIANYLKVDCAYLMTGVSSKNRTVNADLGLSDAAIKALKFINSPPKGVSEITKRHIRKTIEILNILLEDVYNDISFRPFGQNDIDFLNVFSAMHDYVYGSEHISGKIILDDGGPQQEWSASYLWPEKCISDIRTRLYALKSRKEGNQNG